MEEVFDKFHKLCKNKEPTAALEYLLSVQHGGTELSLSDIADIDTLRGHCYREIGDMANANACYRNALLSSALTDYDDADDDHMYLCNTYMHLGYVEFQLRDYHMSLETYRRALSHSCAICSECSQDHPAILGNIAELEKLVTLRTYKSARLDAEEKRICHYCHRVDIGTTFILCGCKHVRYCNDACKLADADAHAATGLHMVIERLPASVFRNHILPLCILPADPDPATWIGLAAQRRIGQLRRTGLGLRTLGKYWKNGVDLCRFFWIDVVPFDWALMYKPNRDILKKYMMHELHAEILQLASSRAELHLKNRQTKLAREVAIWGKAAAKLRTLLEDKEAKRATAEKELEGVESRLKRMKK